MTSGLGFQTKGGTLPESVLWRVVDDLSLFDWCELPTVVRTAKRIAHRKNQSATVADFRAEIVRALT